MRFSILTLACLVAVHPVRASAQAPTTARTSLTEADQAAATAVFREGIQRGLENMLSEDAILLVEGGPIAAGRAQALQVLAAQPPLARLRIQRMPVLTFVSADGLLGATTGASIVTRPGQVSDSAATYGHYIAVWRRADSGAPWRIVALLENGLMGETAFQRPADFTPAPVPTIAGNGRAMADADLAFARLAADSTVGAAFGRYAAPDATFPPGESQMSVGPAALRARMSTPARNQQLWLWQPVFAGATDGGDFGFTVGEATIRLSRAADAQSFATKYLTVWQRQPDGSLKFLLDSGNSR